MYINGENIIFSRTDMHFVKKFGLIDATNMVLDYTSTNTTPFIYDTYQLAEFLGIRRDHLFRFVRNADSMYFVNYIPKSDGTQRQLHVPYSVLKTIQTCILKNILRNIPVSQYATAYKKGAKIRDNASPHVNKKYLLKMDITDFFGSIDFMKVYLAVFNSYRYPKQIGAMLTTLCCYRECLPQGAPTSPAISNIVMKRFDDFIGEWCKKQGISYTRYCDDMTFSSDKPLYHVYKKVSTMLADMGLEINEKKTHFIASSSRQVVTGLTVNNKVSVPKDTRKQLRQELYYVMKFGIRDAMLHSDKKDFFVDGKPDTDRYRDYLIGKISFILQADPENKWFKSAMNTITEI